MRDCLGLTTQLHRYSEGYLIAIIDAPHVTLDEARYLVGRHQILGLFPAAGGKIYVFYMIEAGSYEAIKARGLDALRQTSGFVSIPGWRPSCLVWWIGVRLVTCRRDASKQIDGSRMEPC